MLYIIWAVLIILGLTKRNNKYVTGLILLNIFILYGWSSGNADYNTYEHRYNMYNFEIYRYGVEAGYFQLVRLFHFSNLDYRHFTIATAMIVCCSLLLSINYVNAKEKNWILALYMIFPMCMNIVTLRYALASSIALIGLGYLFTQKNRKLIKAITFITISIFIHFACIYFFLFLLVYYLDMKRAKKLVNTILCGCFVMVFCLIVLNTSLSYLGETSIARVIRATIYVALAKYDTNDIFVAIIQIAIVIMLGLYEYKIIKKSNLFSSKEYDSTVQQFEKINYATLPLIPLAIISGDSFRIQMIIIIFNYMAATEYHSRYVASRGNNYIKSKVSVVSLITFLQTLFMLFMWVLRSVNFQTVFIPMFENNVLFGF